MLDLKPKAVDQTDKVKKKLLSYARNLGSFCDKLNLDWFVYFCDKLNLDWFVHFCDKLNLDDLRIFVYKFSFLN